jgi:transposase
MAVDALGNPLRVILTAGQVADISCAHELIAGLRFDALLADKGYDSDALVGSVEQGAAQAVIPPRSHRLSPRAFDQTTYRQRNLIERFFNRIKHYRRIATRYDKLARTYLAFLQIACALKAFSQM